MREENKVQKFLLKILLVVFIISTFISVQKVLGAEQNTENALKNSNQWNIEFTPYFWAAELKGDATLRGRTGPVEKSFSDLLDDLDIAFMGRAEAWKGEWGLFVDGIYMDLGAEFSTPQGLVSADIVEFGLGYHLWETQVGKEESQKLSFDLLGGGRYMNLEGEVDIVVGGPLAGLGLGRTFGRREEWVDPIVGGRLKWDIDEKLAAAVRFDFGGFDIGDGSSLTWNLVAGIDYKLKENLSLKAGYRIFDLDYDSGSGNKEFGLDAQFRGPIFGLTILF
jgi:opacity protein-like surface antigen